VVSDEIEPAHCGLTPAVPIRHDAGMSLVRKPCPAPLSPATFRAAALALLAAATGPALGHMDPVGDVHPEVRVVNGQFAVTFSNNEGSSPERFSYRSVYDADGTLVIPRHRLSAARQRFMAGWHGGTRRAEGGRSYEVDAACRVLTVRAADGGATRSLLPWPGEDPPLEAFEDFAVLDGRLYVLGTLPHPDGPHYGATLTLHRFDLDSQDPPLALLLGKVATIYHFPTTSRLVVVGGRLAVAWMGEPEGAVGSQFSLTTLDPATMQPSIRALDGVYHWNTQVSMAAIRTRLCIAWHDGEIYGSFRKSKIRVLFEDLRAE